MFQTLVNHNDDIKRLVEKGFAVAFDSGYLVIRDIPYLGQQQELLSGAFVTKMVFIDQEHVTQDDHQVFFAGSSPHQMDGSPIQNLADRAASLSLTDACQDVVVQRQFSNKPRKTGKFSDFFEKIQSYTTIISGPAMEIHDITPYTYRPSESSQSTSVFKFQDTLTSRAEIMDLSAKFKNDIIAVIGLGGTGAYILDFLIKTPVKEIRAFDSDPFHVHNAFRSPGQLSENELGKPKAEIYRSRYENFRTGLSFKPKYVDSTSVEDLDGVTFAFVCVDKGSSRAEIFDLLISKKIPYIDVGMGLKRRGDALTGMMRTTYYPSEKGNAVREMNFADLSDSANDIYKTNIQISELNALNACLAIIKYKQLRNFYFEASPIFHSLFQIGDLKIISECMTDENQT
jgi:hypothetical protein